MYIAIPDIHYIAKGIVPALQSCDSGVPIPSMDTGVYNHHLDMQTASTNICERMGRSQELSDPNQ
ncbi:unnamed protein product [Staurois parvus]|uniref:Uncharacterized protein n=1 Tax=Staurois parvus TaxID=386267 RepID=A0ABN9EB62_9NEOB|nr:unnamed protein product [Staurois parvus]